MCKYKIIVKELFLKIIEGLIFYFAIINIIVNFQRGIPFTPLQWLLNPFYELLRFSVIAWLTLIICEVFVWIWMIVPKEK